ncbi:MAG: hypothetical protein HN337_02355 [Deltaproteobacteria bacterium]|nr:hypothetical protein [Deltaproteobacteria bacterium]
MKRKMDKLSIDQEMAMAGQTSPLDLIKLMGGKTRPVGQGKSKQPDSMLAIYKDRFTYTFIMNDEVASIHYDHRRGEIFFKGHNIKHLDLNHAQVGALEALRWLLEEDEQGRDFLAEYLATLERVFADK